MSSVLQPKSVGEVGQIMAEYLGRDWCKDRVKILRHINELREMVYLEWPKLFTNKFYCCEVECFPEDCMSTCKCSPNHYKGITIPLDIDGVLNVWENEEPLINRSKWFEGREGRKLSSEGQCMETILVHQTFPTERAMPEPGFLKVFNHDGADAGKIITVKVKEGKDLCPKEYNFEMVSDGFVTTGDLVFEIESVVLPGDLVGCVSLYVDDFELSCYPPKVSVPCYRRLKILTPCGTGQVLLHGSQKFQDVCFDNDITEIGSRIMLKEAAKMFRYGDTGTEADEIAKGQRAEQKLRELIRGAIKRDRGNSHQDPSIFNRVSSRRSPSLYKHITNRKNLR